MRPWKTILARVKSNIQCFLEEITASPIKPSLKLPGRLLYIISERFAQARRINANRCLEKGAEPAKTNLKQFLRAFSQFIKAMDEIHESDPDFHEDDAAILLSLAHLTYMNMERIWERAYATEPDLACIMRTVEFLDMFPCDMDLLKHRLRDLCVALVDTCARQYLYHPALPETFPPPPVTAPTRVSEPVTAALPPAVEKPRPAAIKKDRKTKSAATAKVKADSDEPVTAENKATETSEAEQQQTYIAADIIAILPAIYGLNHAAGNHLPMELSSNASRIQHSEIRLQPFLIEGFT